MKNQKIKTSTIFFIIGLLLFVALLFMFAVPQEQQFIGIETGETKIGATGDFSDSVIIILFSIMGLVVLIGILIKYWFENKRR